MDLTEANKMNGCGPSQTVSAARGSGRGVGEVRADITFSREQGGRRDTLVSRTRTGRLTAEAHGTLCDKERPLILTAAVLHRLRHNNSLFRVQKKSCKCDYRLLFGFFVDFMHRRTSLVTRRQLKLDVFLLWKL